MILYGKEMKLRFVNILKCKLQDENIILGNVVGRLNLVCEKMIVNIVKKVVILEVLNQVGNIYNVFLLGVKKDFYGVIYEMDFMCRSLKSQLKIEGYKIGDRNS